MAVADQRYESDHHRPCRSRHAEVMPLSPRVAIIGVPNCGKSLIFSRLTGTFSTSGNYPYTTREIAEKSLVLEGKEYTLLDTPGITGFEIRSEEETQTRELLRTNPPDVILLCADAARLVRSLILIPQLADLEIPMVVGLNMVDEANEKGFFVDHDALWGLLGVPVIPVCAEDGRGIRSLAKNLSRARLPRQVPYPPSIEESLNSLNSSTTRASRLSVLLGDERNDARSGQRLGHVVMEAHCHWAREIASQVVRKTGLEPARTMWNTLARLALHPLGAWVCLLLILAGFYLVVAELGAKFLAARIDVAVVTPLVTLISSWVGPGLLREIFVGQYGLLTLGLFNALGTVLPILAVYYLLFGFLEDVGYFPLLSVQFDRLLRLVGLNGNAVLPITLGFGCNAVAAMAVRGLETKKERFIASFLVSLGIPCACQLGVLIAILSTLPVPAIVGIMSLVFLLQITAGTLLARLLPKKDQGGFLIELPSFRRPRWRNILVRTYHRIAEFVTEAVPLFVAGAATLLILHLSGLLARLQGLLAPVVVSALGLPQQFADAMLIGLARRELAALMLKKMWDGHLLTFRQVFVGLLVMILFAPCVTTSMVLGRVLGWRSAVVIFVAVVVIAIGAGALVNLAWL